MQGGASQFLGLRKVVWKEEVVGNWGWKWLEKVGSGEGWLKKGKNVRVQNMSIMALDK